MRGPGGMDEEAQGPADVPKGKWRKWLSDESAKGNFPPPKCQGNKTAGKHLEGLQETGSSRYILFLKLSCTFFYGQVKANAPKGKKNRYQKYCPEVFECCVWPGRVEPTMRLIDNSVRGTVRVHFKMKISFFLGCYCTHPGQGFALCSVTTWMTGARRSELLICRQDTSSISWKCFRGKGESSE